MVVITIIAANAEHGGAGIAGIAGTTTTLDTPTIGDLMEVTDTVGIHGTVPQVIASLITIVTAMVVIITTTIITIMVPLIMTHIQIIIVLLHGEIAIMSIIRSMSPIIQTEHSTVLVPQEVLMSLEKIVGTSKIKSR